MDTADLEGVYEAFQDFHAYFAPVFGRKESREHSRHYLQGLLVQSQERRNAEKPGGDGARCRHGRCSASSRSRPGRMTV